MGMFDAFDISASGLTAQRYRMDIIAENVANANTTRTENGGIYRRKVVTFEAKGSGTPSFASMLSTSSQGMTGMSNAIGEGVRISSVTEDHTTEMNKVYDPSNPDADDSGYVTYPNVNIITEMTNLIDATRAYEANATALSASKSMAVQGLNIGKG
ncbi:MAG: flagellar basal body rod protein FlgC [Lachnospiraceae bacterium]|nr:flagellar basal body rod protein FlgC [Lachnospiraceae bacterium]